MTQRGSSYETVGVADADRDARRRLDRALEVATVDTEDLDAARWMLLDRLSRRSDDFAATTALQALNTYFAGHRSDAPSDEPVRVRNAGLSSVQRMRRSPVDGSG